MSGIGADHVPRDYYDLWRIFGMFESQLNFDIICSTLPLKCYPKGVSFKDPSDFFDEKMIQYVSKTWHQWLSPLVPDLPDSNIVIEELRARVYSILAHSCHESNP